ncbi:MAG: S-layer homology domain-containing protein, partial [Negativicoccus succinicivorans]|uniref:S-layer homology domain-containing protein n=1 Tax=Negativicoccus succinicivorans TaxID=620903 RepID=UPI0026EA0873
ITDGPGGVMSSWKLKATSGDTTEQAIKNGETVTFAATGEGLTATRKGMTITYGIDGSQINIAKNTTVTGLKQDIKDAKATVKAGDYVKVKPSTEDGTDGTIYTVTGPKVAVVDGEENLVVDDIKEGDKKVGYQLKLKKDLTGLTSVTSEAFKVDDKTYINSNGINANSNKITNVADGDVSATSTDAVNGKQLNEVKTKAETNETNITNLTTRVDGHDTAIQENKTNITNLTGRVDTAEKTIKSNTEAIGKNTKAIEANTENIGKNTKAIEKNAENIGKNAEAIGKNTENIGKNTEAIGKNTENIGKNTDAIAENKAEISKKMTSWNLKAEGVDGKQEIENDGTVTFDVAEKGKGLTVTRDGSTIKYGIDGKTIDISENSTVKKLEENIENSKTTVKSGDDNISVAKTDGKNEYTLTLAEDLKGLKSISSETVNATTVNASGKVTVGDNVTINKEGLTIKEGPSVTTKGIDAGNKAITNVADGKADTDAVNVRQLNAIANRSDQNIAILGGKVSELDGRIDRVGAGAAALAALHPLDFDPDDKWDFAAGYGNYSGANAVAIGAYYRPNEDTMFSVGGSFGGGENMVNAGVSVKLGQGNNVTTSKIAMAKEIKDLRAEVEVLRQAIVGVGQGQELDPMKMKLFPDIEKNHWAYEAVEELAKQGLLEGYPDGTFGGDRMMTRYEFAEVVYRAMQKGLKVNERLIQEFEPELERFRIDVISKDKDGNPVIERVRANQQKAN